MVDYVFFENLSIVLHKRNMIMDKNDSYKACLDFMYGLKRFGIKLGLDLIGNILQNLGSPQNCYRSIHIAGTNGKGSIASGLASIFTSAGYKTGLYTSPHLIRFNERIKIDNSYISDESVVNAYEAVKDANKNSDREPTFFEFSTAMALYEFKRQNIDIAIIETGMGGRLDATNIINPVSSIISNISIEHKMYLGNTIKKITREKGGIIKNNIPVITGVEQKSAFLCLEEIAKEKKAPIYKYKKDFKTRREDNNFFTYFGINNIFRKMKTGLLGRYQTDNASLVIAACEILMKDFPKINEEAIRKGLKNIVWEGRLDIVSKSPFIMLDGAHNIAACRELAFFLKNNEMLKDKDITFILGALDDKPYETILKILLPVCKKAIFTKPIIERAMLPEKLLHTAEKFFPDKEYHIIPDIKDALKYAIENSLQNEAICAAGSLYVVGEAKAYLNESLSGKKEKYECF